MTKKVLWLVTDTSQSGVLQRAQQIGAYAVCIRTTNPWLAGSIPQFHQARLRVFGWRLPAVEPSNSAPHHFVDDEARFVVERLISQGLDGYITDPEEASTTTWNWNRDDLDLDDLARRWCDPIIAAGRRANPDFHFGLSSGWHMPTNCRHLPWRTFVDRSNALYGQFYWFGDHGYQHGNTPEGAFSGGMTSWRTIAQGKPIVPMLGHVDRGTRTWDQVRSDFALCRALIEDHHLAEVHFYAYENNIPDSIWAELAAL
jgi:hypothetical protein